MALPLSPPVFAIFQSLIEERTGLAFDDPEILAEKISRRALETGFESLLDYYYFLRYDEGGPTELRALIDHLVVNETYFFRELDQLELVTAMVKDRSLGGQRTRIWSAACSTGEEPLTIAMLLSEQRKIDEADITATDISGRALDQARSGIYGKRSFRRALPEWTSRFLTPRPDGSTSVSQALTEKVSWRRLNLTDDREVAGLGTFDLILCRNVLIYFNDATARAVIASLTRRLAPGGVLFVGVSESLLRFGTTLSCEEQRGVFFYRKAST